MISIQEPLFPSVSNWNPPASLPDLRRYAVVACDTETKDPHLTTKGTGAIRGDGEVVGISYAAEDGPSGYLPIGHAGGGNLDRGLVLEWMAEQMQTPKQSKVFANALYDMTWLESMGIHIQGQCVDVQGIEALLDEEASSTALDKLCLKYGVEGKNEDLLRKAATEYGIDPKAELWKLPAKYVGAYGEADAKATLEVYRKQLPLIRKEDLGRVLQMECDLLPLLVRMKLQGVRVDQDKAMRLDELWTKQNKELRRKLGVDPWSNEELAREADRRNLGYPRTAKGHPSFTRGFLEHADSPFYRDIVEVRSLDRLHSGFLRGAIIGNLVDGRIHADFNPLRRAEGASGERGARTGRFSSSSPNLQQIPARDELLAPLLRALFIPEDGERWNCNDYSQQEQRVIVHYAAAIGAEASDEAVRRYNEDPSTDFHQMVADMAGIPRKVAKSMNFGMAYGMGKAKLAASLGLAVDDAEPLLDRYHTMVPFVSALSRRCANTAQERGYIVTLGGRRRHFNLWEPRRYEEGSPYIPAPLSAAHKKWPGEALRRYGAHKALNSLIQGSSADMVKLAMLGVWKTLNKVPLMTVHDELSYSIPSGDRGIAEAKAIQDIMEHVLKLKVPILVDSGMGDNWSEAKG